VHVKSGVVITCDLVCYQSQRISVFISLHQKMWQHYSSLYNRLFYRAGSRLVSAEGSFFVFMVFECVFRYWKNRKNKLTQFKFTFLIFHVRGTNLCVCMNLTLCFLQDNGSNCQMFFGLFVCKLD